VTISSCTISRNTIYYVSASKVPNAPRDGIFTYGLRLCLQGGGVYVQGGTVTLSSCTINGNRASTVRRSSSKVPIAPMGDSRFARCLQGGGVYVGGGTVAFSSCNITGNTAVRAHAQRFPSPRWGNC
jgi:hypothetical protein